MPAVSYADWDNAHADHRSFAPKDTRPALQAFLSEHVPDLRISIARIDGVRTYVATFTYDDAEREISAPGEDDLPVLRAVVDKLRERLGMPPLDAPDQKGLEQRIVAAHLAGDALACEQLTRELVMGRQPDALRARTVFSKREIW